MMHHWDEDIAFWRLSSAEEAHYMRRVSQYHARVAVAQARLSVFYAQRAMLGNKILVFLMFLLLSATVINLIFT